jgi:hypothetical protein
MPRLPWLLLLAVLPWTARADLEVVPLRYRTVDQVLPVLRPLVEPGGALSGMSGQLVIRASAANIAELKRVLASIDTRPRRLVVSVRQDADERASDAGASGRVVIGGDGRSRADVRVRDNQASASDRVDQRIQVTEGGIAHLQVGQSIPVPGGYRDVGTGFAVLPRVAGDRVTLDINPRRESVGPRGTVESQSLSTSVSGRLGEWIELGGIDQAGSATTGGLLSRSSSSREGARRVWVRVEALD